MFVRTINAAVVAVVAGAGCGAGIPKEVEVPSGPKIYVKDEQKMTRPSGVNEVPDKPGHFDDTSYRADAFRCADHMNRERNRMKYANGLSITSGVLSLTSAFITGILAAQTTSTRTDAADVALLERPEFYAATFSFLTGLTSATSPFLLGTNEAAERHAQMAGQWESARQASREMERVNGLHESNRISGADLTLAKIEMRHYIGNALQACISAHPPTPAPLPASLLVTGSARPATNP